VIFAFSKAGSAPVCAAGVGPRGTFVASYGLCSGPNTIFSTFLRDYSIIDQTVDIFGNVDNQTTLSIAGGSACRPISLVGAATPLATGAWSATIETGMAAEPPTTWSGPPSWCDGHWKDLPDSFTFSGL
jgi:hypothetical protein